MKERPNGRSFLSRRSQPSACSRTDRVVCVTLLTTVVRGRRPADGTFALTFFATVLCLLSACQSKQPDGQPPGKEPPAKGVNELPRDVLRAIVPDAKHEIYPILKAWDWPAKAFSVHEAFAGTDKPPVPLVAYGYETEDHYIFVGKADLAARPLAEIKLEAFANLEKYPVTWKRINNYVLTASGEEFSAEKILSKEFLVEAQRTLNAKQILVGVPRRTVIYAVDAAAPQVDMEMFYRVFRHTYADDSFGNAVITNLLFEYRDGVLVGAREVDGKS